jgi:hypothetical protein
LVQWPASLVVFLVCVCSIVHAFKFPVGPCHVHSRSVASQPCARSSAVVERSRNTSRLETPGASASVRAEPRDVPREVGCKQFSFSHIQDSNNSKKSAPQSQPPLVEHLRIADDRRGGTMTPRRAISRLEVCLRSHSMSGDGRVPALCKLAGCPPVVCSTKSTLERLSIVLASQHHAAHSANRPRTRVAARARLRNAKRRIMRGEASLAPHPTPTPRSCLKKFDRGVMDKTKRKSVGKNPDLDSFCRFQSLNHQSE